MAIASGWKLEDGWFEPYATFDPGLPDQQESSPVCLYFSDRSGSKIFDRGWVGSAIYGLDLNLENFPKKHQIFKFFAFGSKKICSDRVKKYPGQSQVCLLFTAGQK